MYNVRTKAYFALNITILPKLKRYRYCRYLQEGSGSWKRIIIILLEGGEEEEEASFISGCNDFKCTREVLLMSIIDELWKSTF